MSSFIEQSKQRHAELEAKPYWKCACMPDNNDDTRRHHAMLDECYSILKCFQVNSCLSIGDSRGRDAAYAKTHFKCHSIASDLNTSNLSKAVEDGFIDEAMDIDVESIPFPDSSIDLVIAKESFHHWPRPILGLYEMIRVSRLFTAIIEPYDCMLADPSPYVEECQYHDSYEEVGNYKYQVSLREVIKIAWAMGLPAVIAKGFNDPYEPNQAFHDWERRKQALDELGNNNARQFNLMTIILLKDSSLIPSITSSNQRLYLRPPNPYIFD